MSYRETPTDTEYTCMPFWRRWKQVYLNTTARLNTYLMTIPVVGPILIGLYILLNAIVVLCGFILAGCGTLIGVVVFFPLLGCWMIGQHAIGRIVIGLIGGVLVVVGWPAYSCWHVGFWKAQPPNVRWDNRDLATEELDLWLKLAGWGSLVWAIVVTFITLGCTGAFS